MAKRHPKRQFLEEAGALHRDPDRVRAELFERHRFFDPLDKIQVKYEMLRAHAVEGRSVVSVAEAFGFSRETYYSALAAFEAGGVAWLADGKPGRPGPLKLTDEAAQWVLDLHRRRRDLSGRELAEKLAEELGIEVHRRTIERLLGGGRKKKRLTPKLGSIDRQIRHHFSKPAGRRRAATSGYASTSSPNRLDVPARARPSSTCNASSASACSVSWTAIHDAARRAISRFRSLLWEPRMPSSGWIASAPCSPG